MSPALRDALNLRLRRRERHQNKKKRVVLVTSYSSVAPTYSRSSQGSPVEVFTDLTVPLLPLGTGYIAASLLEAGIDARIVDLTFRSRRTSDAQKVKKEILDLEPSVVGISSFTSTVSGAFDIANELKKEKTDLPVVLGGPHASALPRETLEECPGIDAVVIGEGEYPLISLVEALLDGTSKGSISDMKGILLRRDGKFFGDAVPVYVDDLDLLPFPARQLFDLKRYREASRSFLARSPPVASIVTSRGCPHSCLFCSRVNGGYRFRARSPHNVVAELEYLKKQEFNEALILDDAFTEDRNRVLEICRLIKNRRLRMSFNLIGGIRVDKVDEELLSAMYNAGCYSIHFGAESGDNEVLRNIGKGITAEQIVEAVNMAKRIGYEVSLYVIAGLPGSSLESEKRTLELTRKCMPTMTKVSFCHPYPGSPLWELVKDQIKGVSWDRYSETNSQNPIYTSEGLSKDKIEFWMNALDDKSHTVAG